MLQGLIEIYKRVTSYCMEQVNEDIEPCAIDINEPTIENKQRSVCHSDKIPQQMASGNTYYLVFNSFDSRLTTEVFDNNTNKFIYLESLSENDIKRHLVSRGNSKFFIFNSYSDAKQYVGITASGILNGSFIAYPIYKVQVASPIEGNRFKPISSYLANDLIVGDVELTAFKSIMKNIIDPIMEKIEEEKRKAKEINSEMLMVYGDYEYWDQVLLEEANNLDKELERKIVCYNQQLDLNIRRTLYQTDWFPIAAAAPEFLSIFGHHYNAFLGDISIVSNEDFSFVAAYIPRKVGRDLLFSEVNFTNTIDVKQVSGVALGNSGDNVFVPKRFHDPIHMQVRESMAATSIYYNQSRGLDSNDDVDNVDIKLNARAVPRKKPII